MTVALFSTYAPSEGFGGPARVFHSRRVLESAGMRVVHVVLQASHGSGASRSDDFVRTVERPHGAPIDHIYHDVDLGRRAAGDRRLVAAIVRHLAERGVGVLLLEQPFLAEVVAQVSAELRVPVVYSSQNIEFRLRRELERFQYDWKRPTDRWEQVRDIEAAAIDMAAEVTSIAPTDRDALIAEFGRDSTVVPNGSALADLPIHRSSMADVDFAFAGSSYWPNVEGFAQIATPSLAFLPPTARLHIAGTVGGQLLVHPVIARHHSVNASRMVVHGFVSASEMHRVMGSSRAVIVPVFIGEGSNLKSADALASGAPVIMTERAVRGYEDVVDADPEGVTVVDGAVAFRSALADAMAASRPERPVGQKRHRMLRWSARLEPLAGVVRAVANGSGRR